MLWIAFIYQYLWDTQQHSRFEILSKSSCELLSFISIFGIHNNSVITLPWNGSVVNCFHLSVSLGYTTTVFINSKTLLPLWIAFIYQYLWDTQQRGNKIIIHSSCCELLSFISIFGIHNNIKSKSGVLVWVVNCFHLSVSLGYTTTCSWLSKPWSRLWIAFIYQYLWDTQQLTAFITPWWCRCELLSFISIFGIHNNLNFLKTVSFPLWIAFIYQYLWDTQQLSSSKRYEYLCCELLSFISIFGIHNN